MYNLLFMNKFLIILLWIFWLFIMLLVGFYNSVILIDENLKSSYSQINNMYERRVELISQVSSLVKNFMNYEKPTHTDIVNFKKISDNLDKINGLINKRDVNSIEVSNLLASTISQIKIDIEAYPNLKTDIKLVNLFTELEWSENIIRMAIMDYNNKLISYNSKILSFPWNIFAGFFWFKEKERINPPEWRIIKEVPNINKLINTSK